MAEVFTYDTDLRALLPIVWRSAMTATLDTLDADAALHGDQFWYGYAIAALLPVPEPRSGDDDVDATLTAARTDWIHPDTMLDLIERWIPYRDTGADLLWRVSSTVQLPLVRWLPDGSYLSVAFHPKMRGSRRTNIVSRAQQGLAIDPSEGHLIRVVEYDVPDRTGNGTGELICVITSILDPVDATAEQLAGAYHQRWECEGLIDEVKTHQRGPAKVLRSQSPEMVRQEIWAFLLTHYGIRHLMCRAADEIGEDPDRLSFIRSLRIIRRHIAGQADFSP